MLSPSRSMDSQLNAIEQASNVLHPELVVPVPSILVTSSNSSPIRSPQLVLVPSRTDYGRGSPRGDVLPADDRRNAELQMHRSRPHSRTMGDSDDERFVRPPPPSTPLRTPAKGAGTNHKTQRKGRLAAFASAFKASIRKTPKTLCAPYQALICVL